MIQKYTNNLIQELEYYNDLPRGEYTPFSPSQQIIALKATLLLLNSFRELVSDKPVITSFKLDDIGNK